MHSNLENSFTRSFYFSLLWWLNISPAQGFNYRAVEHLKQAWLELKTGEGVCLPGMLAGWQADLAATTLAVMCKMKQFQALSVPGFTLEKSREGLTEGEPWRWE